MKIAILTPVYADPKARFLECLANLIACTGGYEIRTFVEPGLLPLNRNILAVKAAQWGADSVLWADSDMTFEPDALKRLLAQSVDIVGTNYVRRDGSAPTAGRFDGGEVAKLVRTTAETAREGKLEEVEQLGLGLCLISGKAMRALQEAANRERLPLFHLELRGGTYFGEDNFFFARARRLGFKIHLDHAVSWTVGHIGERILTNGGSSDVDTVRAPAGAE